MLQIISGKFFMSDDRFHNDSKGILYSNAYVGDGVRIGFITINYVASRNNVYSYVVSFDIQIQKLHHGSQFVKCGSGEVINCIKNILSIAFNCIFDENIDIVNNLCRKEQGNGLGAPPSSFIYNTLDQCLNVSLANIVFCNKFFNHMIGLKRNDYKTLLSCIIAYNTSLKIMDDDLNLSYSMLVYCLEAMSQHFDNYTAIWDEYDESIRCKLEAIFTLIPQQETEKIKNVLIKDKQFKLSQRFKRFIEAYLGEEYYSKNDRRYIIYKDDIEVALGNAYNSRSHFAHSLKPLMMQLLMSSFSKDSDTFEFDHNIYFTYSGLLRTTREVICNLLFSLPTIETEEFDWYNELPGGFFLQKAPYFWIWREDNQQGDGASARFEGFLQCLVYYRKSIPNMDNVITAYLDHLSNMSEENKYAAYALCFLYCRIITNIDHDKLSRYNIEIDRNKSLFNKCCIYNMIVYILFPPPPEEVIEWNLSDCELIINSYNKNKHKSNHLRLPSVYETMLYTSMAHFAYDENSEVCSRWLKKAFQNSTNNPDVQTLIKSALDTNYKDYSQNIWSALFNNLYSD